jgi:AcrR family transcriptional regulator
MKATGAEQTTGDRRAERRTAPGGDGAVGNGRAGDPGSAGATSAARRRRSDGERSRRAILDAATRLASVEGLEGLSIGRLAEHTGMSKSGLYAHFGSKEDLQLATIDAASDVFEREVTAPAMGAPPGRARLTDLCEGFLSHLERRVFPGGCFFASVGAELDARPGPLTDRIREAQVEWLALLAKEVRAAQTANEVAAEEDVDQLTFELDALLLGAHAMFVLFDDVAALRRARHGVERRLSGAVGAGSPHPGASR